MTLNLTNLLLAWIVSKLFTDEKSHASAPAPAVYVPPTPAFAPSVVPTVTPATYAPPWPSAKPSDLPPFPGPDWEPDNPPPPDVVARANRLLSTLWAHGEGTAAYEQTGGRWIAYRATAMGSKKGVVAYRLRTPIAVAPAAAIPQVAPQVVTTSAPPAPTSPGTPPSSAAPPPSSLHLSTLRYGSKGPDVQLLQKQLGLTADGDFGPKTLAAVKTFQALHGLAVDGVVGPKTWGVLFAGSAS